MQSVWMPHSRGFLKTCPVCKNEFVGRKNKVFCTTACKNRHHNDANAELRAEEKEISGMLVRNERVFKKRFQESDQKTLNIPIEVLENNGFDMTGPTTEIQDKSGTTWYKLVNYAYKVNLDKQSLTITKLK